jgi:hypothetical protein
MGIVISQNGRNAQIIEKSEFEKEDFLQEYIQNNPEAIPIYELQDDRRLFVAKREFPTNSGPIDALAFDEIGNIYVVETKLYRNPDKRTVVAQALDYGAALWKHFTDFPKFVNILDREAHNKFGVSFQDKVQSFYSFNEAEYDGFLEGLKRCLNDGDIKFVILMDALDERLKDLIVYVNQNSQFDIYAVKLEYYKFKEHEIIIPKIFGVEVKKNVKGYTDEEPWDEETFFKEYENKELLGEAKVARAILNWSNDNKLRVWWGRGKVTGSFVPVFDSINNNYQLFAVFTSGTVEIYFQWFQKKPPFDQESTRLELLSRLNSISGVTIPESSITKRPSINLSLLVKEESMNKFLAAFDWFLQVARGNQ